MLSNACCASHIEIKIIKVMHSCLVSIHTLMIESPQSIIIHVLHIKEHWRVKDYIFSFVCLSWSFDTTYIPKGASILEEF